MHRFIERFVIIYNSIEAMQKFFIRICYGRHDFQMWLLYGSQESDMNIIAFFSQFPYIAYLSVSAVLEVARFTAYN